MAKKKTTNKRFSFYKDGGSKQDWISHKISILIKEGYDKDQAAAIAYSMYEKSHHQEGGVHAGINVFPKFITEQDRIDFENAQRTPPTIQNSGSAWMPQIGLSPSNMWNTPAPTVKPAVVQQKAIANAATVTPTSPTTVAQTPTARPQVEAVSSITPQGMTADFSTTPEAAPNFAQEMKNRAGINEQGQTVAQTQGLNLDVRQPYQFFQPYAGVDLETSAYNFGQQIGEGDVAGSVVGGINFLTKGARTFLGGLGSGKVKQEGLKKYYQDQYRNISGSGTQGYMKEGGEYNPIPNFYNDGGEQPCYECGGEYQVGGQYTVSGSPEITAQYPNPNYQTFTTNSGENLRLPTRGNYSPSEMQFDPRVIESGRAPRVDASGKPIPNPTIRDYQGTYNMYKGVEAAKPMIDWMRNNPNTTEEDYSKYLAKVRNMPNVDRYSGQLNKVNSKGEVIYEGEDSPESKREHCKGSAEGMRQRQAVTSGAMKAEDGGEYPCFDCGGSYHQDGGEQQEAPQDPQVIMQQVAEALQQGADPQAIAQQLMQMGLPQGQINQIMQAVTQQTQASFQEGGIQEAQAQQGQMPPQEAPQQVDPQAIMGQIAEALQQGVPIEQIQQQMVQMGIPQEQIAQIIQAVMQQVQPQQGQQFEEGGYFEKLRGKKIMNYSIDKNGDYVVELED